MLPDYGDSRLPERFWEKVHPEPNTGCWLWSGATLPSGYGRYNLSRTTGKGIVYAHRFIYENLVGPIGPGLFVDHTCRVKWCVNPAHLEPVTPKVNAERWAQTVLQCPQGHEYDEGNTYRYANGSRHCRTCDRDRKRRQRSVGRFEGEPV